MGNRNIRNCGNSLAVTPQQFIDWLNEQHPGAFSLTSEEDWGFLFKMNDMDCACIKIQIGVMCVYGIDPKTLNPEKVILSPKSQFAPSLRSLALLLHIEA